MKNFTSVIIVTYNSQDHIQKCLKSLQFQLKTDFEVIIVDNNSSDKTIKEINEIKNISTKILRQTQNLGFSRANNIGAKESKGDILLFLNPDTEIEKIDLQAISDYLSNSDIGIIAPKLVMDDGKVQSSVMNIPTLKNALLEYWLGQKNKYSQYAPTEGEPIQVEAVYGAAIFIKRVVYESVGGFDNKYFLYFEDIDLCRKIRDKGLKVIYCPEYIVKHSVGASSKTNPKTRNLFIESAKKFHGLFKYYLLYLILRLRPLYR